MELFLFVICKFISKNYFMKKLFTLSFILIISIAPLFSQTTTINLGTTNVEAKNIYTSAGLPWELKYGPGDSLWMTTRDGNVFRIHPETGLSTLLLNHSANVAQSGESGMLGMAFHPEFTGNPFVYIVYTYLDAGNIKERLSRFTYANNALSNETVLLQNITGNTTHDGSRLLVLPDNTIIMTTGDAQNLSSPQNINNLSGKILRLNLDGSIPLDNPTAGSYVYTLGHRNGQGLMLHPNGKIYETEHGPDSNDEFQIIEAGRNYGWPNVVGFCDNDIAGETVFCTANNVKEPLASWNVIPGGTWAPNDLIWYGSAAIPEFQNTILVTFLKTNKIRRIQLNAAGSAITGQTDFFVNQWGRLRDITTAPNGDIFLATNTPPFKIIRIRNLNILPVTISKLNAACEQKNININFTASAAVNVSRYLIYTANEISNFMLAASLPAQSGQSNTSVTYSLKLPNTFKFYKIVTEDVDGTKKETAYKNIECGNNISFIISPNPTTDYFNLSTNNSQDFFLLQVYNSVGVKVFEERRKNNTSVTTTSWAKGLYLVSIRDRENKILFRDKIMKN